MTAHELLSELRQKGVEIRVTGGDRLVIDAPRGIINDELRNSLAANKGQLLEILKAEQPESAANSETPIPEPSFEAAKPEIPDEAKVVPSATEHSFERTNAEIARLENELLRLRAEEEARRSAVEAARLAAENSLRGEQEKWRQTEEEMAQKRAEHERQRIEAEARERVEEQQRREIADQELARAEEDLIRMRKMEDARRAEVDQNIAEAQRQHQLKLDALRQAEEEQARRRAEEERRYLESEARKRVQEDELRRLAESRFRAVEEEIHKVRAREEARVRAAQEAKRLAEEAERRRHEEEARRAAEAQARQRAEEEARLRAEIETQMRAEAEERRRVEEEARLRAEEEARRRAQEEAQRLAAERARRLAEEAAQRRTAEEARLRAEETARQEAEEQNRLLAEEQAKQRAEQETRLRAEAEVRQRAELEARIRAEIEAKIRAEEAERDAAEAARRAERERVAAEEAARIQADSEQFPEPVQTEFEEVFPGPPSGSDGETATSLITEWFDVEGETREPIRTVESRNQPSLPNDHFALMPDESGAEFLPVSVPETSEDESSEAKGDTPGPLSSDRPAERAAAVSDLPRLGGEEAFRQISAAFDDPSVEVRSAAALAMFEFQEDRAAAFTRALREANPERRRKIGSAIASSGLANDAIRNLTGENREKTYDAFSLLFLMSKAGEVLPLMRAIEEHPNVEVRLAVVKLLALSGQPDILPAFRRMAVRGTLPPEVRSAVMEAIYQINTHPPGDFGSR